MEIYKFQSPIIVNIGDENSCKTNTNPLTLMEEYEETIEKAVNENMRQIGSSGLAEYFNYEKLENGIIESIIVTVENCAAVTIVKAKKELTLDELEVIKDFISEEFYHGWGERFGQQILEDWRSSNHDDGGYHITTMTAGFWNSKNWNIILE